MRISRILLATLLLVTLPLADAPAQKAMIYGTDATSTPDTVTLPSVEAWFTQNYGGTGNGTQVPSYWVNKVGGELSAAIQTACAQSLNMSAYNQLAFCMLTLINSVKTVTPAQVSSAIGVSIGPGYSSNISEGFTAPSAGYAVARGWINTSNVFPTGGIVTLSITNSVNGTQDGDASTSSQWHEIIVPLTAGQAVTFYLQVTASSGSWAADACTYRLAYEFFPNGA